YRVVLDALAGRPLVVRTLDVGGDKPLPYLPIAEEENPFLGLRGIRLTLRRPELLKQQLTALLKASDNRPLRIMFPMIGRVEEWRAAKAILDEVRAQHPCDNLQVGIMIEVPSAALLAPVLAQEVDFFSIGTNDLTQYTLAIDRGHPILSAEADGLHPSILNLIDQTVKAAH
ncbi:phosphoenolpyruvate--protein phosphotransferase, partial [Klebsiella pneumoniae]|nr:phosphoenolpyruvate--protein phosphotransferase [Klebsiella pneumoniae]